MISLSNAKRYLGLKDKEVSIVGNGSLAIATSPDHDLKIGDQVEIKNTTSYNGVFTIIGRDAGTFRFSHAANTTEQGLIVQHDFKLQLIINGVEAYINNYTASKWLGSATVSNKILDCSQDGVITDLSRPINTVTDIKISEESNFSDASKYTTLSASDYLLYEEKIELRASVAQAIFGARQSIKISYTTSTLPSGLEKAAYDLLAYFYQIENDKASNLLSRSNNNQQSVYQKSIPEYITAQLDPYIKIKAGIFSRSPRGKSTSGY